MCNQLILARELADGFNTFGVEEFSAEIASLDLEFLVLGGKVGEDLCGLAFCAINKCDRGGAVVGFVGKLFDDIIPGGDPEQGVLDHVDFGVLGFEVGSELLDFFDLEALVVREHHADRLTDPIAGLLDHLCLFWGGHSCFSSLMN